MSQYVDTPVKTFEAGEAITQYARVKFNASSQVVEADADDIETGTALKAAAASGDHVAVLLRSAGGTRKVICNAAVAVNAILYGADEGEVDDAAGLGPGLYRALEAGSGAGSIIEAATLENKSGLIFAGLADSAEVENDTAETAFDKSKTIDGAGLAVGDVIEVIAQAEVVDNNSTDTLNLKLKFGTEVIAATGAVDVADADVGYIHAFITIRTLGASGTLSACGVHALGVEGTVTAKPFNLPEATEDISGDVAITVTGTWSVAHADNEVKLENLIVIKHRQ